MTWLHEIIVFGQLNIYNVKPDVVAFAMLTAVYVYNHVGLVDLCEKLLMKLCLIFLQKCVKWRRQGESTCDICLGFGRQIWTLLTLEHAAITHL